MKQRVLDKVVRVGDVAGPPGQASAGPPAQRRKVALEQGVERAGVAVASSPAGAQLRKLEQYGSGAPEAKLMLYYSSAVAFSPLGVPYGVQRPSAAIAAGRTPPRLEASLELSYLPSLSVEQRTTGSDKPEATNLAPVFARPRVAARLLRRVSDFALVEKEKIVDAAAADRALKRLDVDALGLDALDRRYLKLIAEHFGGGPQVSRCSR